MIINFDLDMPRVDMYIHFTNLPVPAIFTVHNSAKLVAHEQRNSIVSEIPKVVLGPSKVR